MSVLKLVSDCVFSADGARLFCAGGATLTDVMRTVAPPPSSNHLSPCCPRPRRTASASPRRRTSTCPTRSGGNMWTGCTAISRQTSARSRWSPTLLMPRGPPRPASLPERSATRTSGPTSGRDTQTHSTSGASRSRLRSTPGSNPLEPKTRPQDPCYHPAPFEPELQVQWDVEASRAQAHQLSAMRIQASFAHSLAHQTDPQCANWRRGFFLVPVNSFNLAFDEVIDQAVGHCEVLLVMIGKRWMEPERTASSRLNDPRTSSVSRSWPRCRVPCQSRLLGGRCLDGPGRDGVALDGSDQLDLLPGVTRNRSRFLIGELVDLTF